MSLYMGSMMGAAGFEVNPAKLQLAEEELAQSMKLFENIVENCRTKCFPPYYAEEELTKGEVCCIDRCVSKFMQSNILVSQNLQYAASQTRHTATGQVLPTLGTHKMPTSP